VTTPGSPLFALDAEADVSMEWDLYQLKEELDRVKTEQLTALALTESREDELRKSLALDKKSVEDAIRREVLRATGQIEMQSVNASHHFEHKATHLTRLLNDAETLMKSTEDRLKLRERELLSNAEGMMTQAENRLRRREQELLALASTPPTSVSPFREVDLSTPAANATVSVSALERARARRRLLHEVTDTFSLNEIVTQARQLASDLEYRLQR
jgi:ribosomal protein L35